MDDGKRPAHGSQTLQAFDQRKCPADRCFQLASTIFDLRGGNLALCPSVSLSIKTYIRRIARLISNVDPYNAVFAKVHDDVLCLTSPPCMASTLGIVNVLWAQRMRHPTYPLAAGG